MLPSDEVLLFNHACEFVVNPDDDWREWVVVRKMARGSGQGAPRWSVAPDKPLWQQVWDRTLGEFVPDTPPSERTDDYYTDCRFDTLAEAWDAAEMAVGCGVGLGATPASP